MAAAIFDKPGWRDAVIVIMVLGVVALFAWRAGRDKANTFDELIHITAGVSYWTMNDYRLQPENGNLPQRVAGLLPAISGAHPGLPTDSVLWEYSGHWQLADEAWFKSGADHRKILRLGRAGMLAFNLLGIGLVFIVSASFWGRAGGYLSLLLAGFSPNFLGHLSLATSDFTSAWTLVLATFLFAGLSRKITTLRIILAGLVAGLALVSKHSAVVFGLVAVLLVLYGVLRKQALPVGLPRLRRSMESRQGKFSALLCASLISGLIAWAVIWTFYGFRYSAANPEQGEFKSFLLSLSTIRENGGLPNAVIAFLMQVKALPEAYLYGIEFVLDRSTRTNFLNGVFYNHGNPLYFAFCFLYKTPLPAMVLHIAGVSGVLALAVKRRGRLSQQAAGFVVLAILYSLLLASSSMNIGYRHAYPVLLVSCIGAGCIVSRKWELPPVARIAALVSVALLPVVSWMNIDRTISYMNVFGGGPEKGYRHLRNSSLDWGQDLPAAAALIARYRAGNPGVPVHFSYFGSADPAAFGIHSIRYLPAFRTYDRPNYVARLEPGLYVLGASSLLTGVEEWGRERELGYRLMSRIAADLYGKLGNEIIHTRQKVEEVLTEEELSNLDRYENFRMMRLATLLMDIEPDKVINGTILVYSIDETFLQQVPW